MGRGVILFELNEVPFKLLDHMIALDPEGFLSKATGRAQQFRTRVPIDYGQLDPWISWPTLHRGVTDGRHGILHLGQNLARADAEFPPIWRMLHAEGVTTGVFGSLHSSSLPADYESYAFYLPDYFANEATAHPAALSSFQRFNLAMTRASARNVDRGLGIGEAAGFLGRAPQLGVRPSTAQAVAVQLATEVRSSDAKLRRRNIQPLIMYDLFERQLSKSRPAFATFYTNHVAAAMHRYWAATFADAPADMDHEWKLRYVAELPAAMGTFAGIFRRLLRWVHTHPEYVVIVAGSMGQDGIAAQKSYDFLTVSDGPRFCSALGLPDGAFTLLPAMAPCVSVEVAPEFRNSFRDQLTGMSIDGTPMIRDHRTFHPLCFDEQDGTFMLYVAIDDYAGPAVANVRDRDVPFAELGLGMMAHEDGVNCTAQHTAEGMLLVYDPRRKYQNGHERPEVLVTDIVPSLLDNFDVERPGYLEGEASLSFA